MATQMLYGHAPPEGRRRPRVAPEGRHRPRVAASRARRAEGRPDRCLSNLTHLVLQTGGPRFWGAVMLWAAPRLGDMKDMSHQGEEEVRGIFSPPHSLCLHLVTRWSLAFFWKGPCPLTSFYP